MRESPIASSKRDLVATLQRLDKVEAIIVNYVYDRFIVLGVEPFWQHISSQNQGINGRDPEAFPERKPGTERGLPKIWAREGGMVGGGDHKGGRTAAGEASPQLSALGSGPSCGPFVSQTKKQMPTDSYEESLKTHTARQPPLRPKPTPCPRCSPQGRPSSLPPHIF